MNLIHSDMADDLADDLADNVADQKNVKKGGDGYNNEIKEPKTEKEGKTEGKR